MIAKINVLQVIPKLGYGGAETGCYDIAHYLAEQECGSYIATSGGELLKFVKKNKVGVFKIPVHSKNPILMAKAFKDAVIAGRNSFLAVRMKKNYLASPSSPSKGLI